MKAEIIAIGTEILLGQIVNTNAQYLSQQLAEQGIPVYYHAVVGDNRERLQHQLQIAQKRSDLIILTGGLGPTKDDLTKETIAALLQRSLIMDEQAMKRIHQHFSLRNQTMTENNKRQALVIEGATVLPNDTGLAPGMSVTDGKTHLMLFPGPPRELQPMFDKYALPLLRSLQPDKKTVYSKVLRFCGIGESALETELQDLIDQQTSPTIAPLAKEGEVTLRLTSFSDSAEQAEQEMESVITEIRSRVGQYLYSLNDQSLETVAQKALRQRDYTLSVAESCTGGLISSMLTSVSGASQVLNGSMITYTNEMKNKHLSVPQDVLQTHGAVSERTAQIMAKNVREVCGTQVGLSVTGVAGPSSQENKPVGLLYIAVATPSRTHVEEIRLTGTREVIQLRAAKLALYFLIRELNKS